MDRTSVTTDRPALAHTGQANSAYRAMAGLESEEEIVTETKNWNCPSQDRPTGALWWPFVSSALSVVV